MRDYTALIDRGYYNKLFSIYEKSDQPTMYDDTITIDKNYYDKLKKETTWISVKDELPETDANVLIYTELRNTFVASKVDAETWEDDYGFILAEGVTHWMPLPSPPENEE